MTATMWLALSLALVFGAGVLTGWGLTPWLQELPEPDKWCPGCFEHVDAKQSLTGYCKCGDALWDDERTRSGGE